MSILSEPATTVAERRASGFQPIADYGLLADCNVRRAGRPRRVDRLAVPAALRLADAVFARILDPDAGHWSIAPGRAEHLASAATCRARS